MEKINLNIQKKFNDFLNKLVELGIYPSRNEAIRTAIKEFIAKESIFIQNLNFDMAKLKDIHRKYTEFKNDTLRKIGIISTDYEHSTISSGKDSRKEKQSEV